MKKRPKKIILSWLLALSLLLSLLPSAALAADSEGTSGNISWSLDTQTGTLTLSGSGTMNNYPYSYTPWYSYNKIITSAVIEDGITSIGNYAFYGCTALTNVTIPDSVTSIGNYTFADCTVLADVTISDSVTSIGDCAFSGCTALTGVTIPASVSSLGSGVFSDCIGLTSAVLNCNSVSDDTFSGCTGLTEVSLGGSPTSVGSSAFYNCAALTSIVLPETVAAIDSSAFYGCSSLVGISFSSAVTSVGDEAFSGCDSLTYVYYGGTEDQWGAITFGNSNEAITDRAVVYRGSAAHTHFYIDPVFTVSEDGGSVTAAFVCEMGDDTQTVDCTILSVAPVSDAGCAEEGQMAYAVSCTFQGAEYSGTAIWIPGDHTYEPEFTWADDCASCTALLVCSVCGDITASQTCVVSSAATQAECMENGAVEYTAQLTYDGQTYTDKQTVVLSAAGHTYGTPVFTWSSGYGACTACSTCSVCGETETASCTVTSVDNGDGTATYTAAVVFGGTEYTDEQIGDAGHTHTYGDPVFTWASDYSSATAAFVCTQGDDTQTVNATVTVSTTAATCTQDGETVYTASVVFNSRMYTSTQTVTIPAGHSYTSAVTLQPTRYTTGTTTYTCSVCGASYTEEIPVTGATFLFDDVTDASRYYYVPVYWGYDLGVTTGTSAAKFSPDASCTRAQFVAFLYRLAAATGADTSLSDTDSTAFTDVSSGASYYNAVLWAVKVGVTTGTSSTTFAPSRTITRREAIAMLYRYECAMNGTPTVSTANPFTDVSTDDYAYTAILWAAGQGITSGTGAGRFSPAQSCTRAMMISYLYRYSTGAV